MMITAELFKLIEINFMIVMSLIQESIKSEGDGWKLLF